MIECKNVSFSYLPNSESVQEIKTLPTLRNISCTINDGEFVLLCGTSGCGKTTFTRLINGLIPHYYEGNLSGNIYLDEKEYKDMSLFEISKRVGSVFQNPRSQFFNVDTTSELAFGPENHGISENVIRSRMTNVIEKMQISNLIDRSIFALSGGEKQKIACASVSMNEPDLFVFDEPSSNLDTYAIQDLRKFLIMLKKQGDTIVIAEHRLYYLFDLVDRVLYMKDGEIKQEYTKDEFILLSDMKREKMGLRPLNFSKLQHITCGKRKNIGDDWEIEKLFCIRNNNKILMLENIRLALGSVMAIIGHNGAGKTTFSRCLCGLEKCKGIIRRNGEIYNRKQRLKLCYMVMQDVNHQLFTEAVSEEIRISMKYPDESKVDELLSNMDLLECKELHPMGLSGGQKQRVAITSAIASERPIIIFDEPTSGLDFFHMRQVAESINKLADEGRTILIVTHDPEFILRCCDQVLHIERGQVIEQYALKEDKERKKMLAFFFGEK